MKTYSEKLKDPRWIEFRERVMTLRGGYCELCGPDGGKIVQVHHKRYVRGLEPWEYSDDDVTLLCRECHDDIHDCETKWRNMIRSMPAYMVHEFAAIADAFEGMSPRTMWRWASYCKNQARSMKGFQRDEAAMTGDDVWEESWDDDEFDPENANVEARGK